MSRPQALITGGSRGIGRAICLELAAQGYDLAFTYRANVESANSLLQELSQIGSQARGYLVDMVDLASLEETLKQILEQFPQISVLVNNAGVAIDGLVLRYKANDFNKIMDTNVRAGFITTQFVLKPMMKARQGSIVFISSVIAQMGNAGQVPYATTKAALLGLTKSLAKEVGSRNIRVNAIAPGFIRTDMTENLPASNKEGILAKIPLGKFGEAQDVAKAVAFLASPASQYITGHVLAVNGGLYM